MSSFIRRRVITMNLFKTVTSVVLLLVALQVDCAESSKQRQVRVRHLSSFLVDRIHQHNSDKLWWWSSHSQRPLVANKPKGGIYSKQWLLFVSYHFEHKTIVVEVATKSPDDGKCRFVVRNRSRTGLMLNRRQKCKAGLNGERGFFITSFDELTSRVQISAGSRRVSETKRKFIGLKSDRLALTSLRGSEMAWWIIDSRSSCKHCKHSSSLESFRITPVL